MKPQVPRNALRARENIPARGAMNRRGGSKVQTTSARSVLHEMDLKQSRNSLEDGKHPHDATLSEQTIMKDNKKADNLSDFGNTYVQVTETVVDSKEDYTIVSQENDVCEFGQTFVQKQQSQGSRLCCLESDHTQPIVAGNATLVNDLSGRVSEIGSMLEAPALHSTVLIPQAVIPSQQQQTQLSPAEKKYLAGKKAKQSLQRNWKCLGRLENLTPISKRKSQMHQFHDLGESTPWTCDRSIN